MNIEIIIADPRGHAANAAAQPSISGQFLFGGGQ
jgi:hypothetical protein